MMWDGSPDIALNSFQAIDLFLRNKGNCYARSACATGTPDAVDVVFGKLWQIEIYNMADACDVDSPRRDIGCHEQPDFTPAHIGNGAVAGILLHIAVQGRRCISLRTEPDGNVIGIALGCRKDNRPGQVPVIDEMLEHTCLVFKIISHQKALFDVLMAGFLGCDQNFFRLVENPLASLSIRASKVAENSRV
jgi:hypothetical protein